VGVLAFICTGPEGYEPNMTALGIIGLAGINMAPLLALYQINMKVLAKIVVFSVVTLATSYFAFALAFLAAIGSI
jgi:hypothetical protein